MEPYFVAILSILMATIMVFFLLKKPPYVCPKCGYEMFKEIIDNKKVFICRECGHAEQRKK